MSPEKEPETKEDPFKSTCFNVTFLLTKHLLLSICLLMVIWSLVKIPMMDGLMAERKMFPDDLPPEYVQRIKTIVILSKLIIVALAFFGVLGIIRESFNLMLVFDVFMFFRMIASYYVPYFDNGPWSNTMIFAITCLALLFTYLLLRRANFEGDNEEDMDGRSEDTESNLASSRTVSQTSKSTIASTELIIVKV